MYQYSIEEQETKFNVKVRLVTNFFAHPYNRRKDCSNEEANKIKIDEKLRLREC
jgi:hypothetical protein